MWIMVYCISLRSGIREIKESWLTISGEESANTF